MADNITVTPGTGKTIAADDIGGVLHQRVKIEVGVDGSAADVSSSNPLPITTSVTLDYDSGAGTQNIESIGIALPALGGAVAGGTATNPVRTDPTGTTTQPVSTVSRVVSSSDVHAPTSNTDAVITYTAAGSGISHVVSGIYWSYSTAPSGGNLKIENGSGITIFSLDITTTGSGFIPFTPPRKGTANTALIITLAAGGSGVTGKVNAAHWTE